MRARGSAPRVRKSSSQYQHSRPQYACSSLDQIFSRGSYPTKHWTWQGEGPAQYDAASRAPLIPGETTARDVPEVAGRRRSWLACFLDRAHGALRRRAHDGRCLPRAPAPGCRRCLRSFPIGLRGRRVGRGSSYLRRKHPRSSINRAMPQLSDALRLRDRLVRDRGSARAAPCGDVAAGRRRLPRPRGVVAALGGSRRRPSRRQSCSGRCHSHILRAACPLLGAAAVRHRHRSPLAAAAAALRPSSSSSERLRVISRASTPSHPLRSTR